MDVERAPVLPPTHHPQPNDARMRRKIGSRRLGEGREMAFTKLRGMPHPSQRAAHGLEAKLPDLAGEG